METMLLTSLPTNHELLKIHILQMFFLSIIFQNSCSYYTAIKNVMNNCDNYELNYIQQTNQHVPSKIVNGLWFF